jgi:hypothetical protein
LAFILQLLRDQPLPILKKLINYLRILFDLSEIAPKVLAEVRAFSFPQHSALEVLRPSQPEPYPFSTDSQFTVSEQRSTYKA